MKNLKTNPKREAQGGEHSGVGKQKREENKEYQIHTPSLEMILFLLRSELLV